MSDEHLLPVQIREMKKLLKQVKGDDKNYIKVADHIVERQDKLIKYLAKKEMDELMEEPISRIGSVPKLKRCDCGAKHTAFPNAHSNWCTAKKW